VTWPARIVWAVLALALLVTAAGVAFGEDDDDRRARERTKAANKIAIAVHRAEFCERERYGRYTASIAELQRIVGGLIVPPASDHGLDVDLSVGRRGLNYVVRVRGRGVDVYLGQDHESDSVDIGLANDADPPARYDCP